MTIDPPGLQDAEIGAAYSFTFNADSIPTDVNGVYFTWSFGTGTDAGKSSDIAVSNRMASTNVNQTYSSNGGFGLTVDVRDATTGEVLGSFYGLTK